jgi:hypothetical protein
LNLDEKKLAILKTEKLVGRGRSHSVVVLGREKSCETINNLGLWELKEGFVAQFLRLGFE